MRVLFLQFVFLPLAVSVACVCFAADSSGGSDGSVPNTLGAPDSHAAPDVQATSLSLSQHLFRQLPANLTPQQQRKALAVLTAAGPRIAEAQIVVTTILDKLRKLSFNAHTQADLLTELGQELVVARDALRAELGRVGDDLEKAIGLNPEWDRPRSCSMPQMVHAEPVHKN